MRNVLQEMGAEEQADSLDGKEVTIVRIGMIIYQLLKRC